MLILNGNRVAHLALHALYQQDLLEYVQFPIDHPPPIVPAMLHPTAALSFASILCKLRSILCVDSFRPSLHRIGLTGFYNPTPQTFPCLRRGCPTNAIDWLEADPRPGVQLELKQMNLVNDPRCLARAWWELEESFGVGRMSLNADGNVHSTFYICPAECCGWHAPISTPESKREAIWTLRLYLTRYLPLGTGEEDPTREHTTQGHPGGGLVPGDGTIVDAEASERKGRAPRTAIGMWLFRADAFKEPTGVRYNQFDVSAVRPGLILYEC